MTTRARAPRKECMLDGCRRKRVKAHKGYCRRSHQNIAWIQKFCRIPEGKDVGKNVVLRPWQREILEKIYDNPHGTRRAIISFAKKNAKTSLSAFLLLLHLAGREAIRNTQLPSTAQSRDQAAVIFELAAKIVRMSPDLAGEITIRDTVKQLICPRLGTTYMALSADAATAHGKSPAFAVHDELGQVRGPVSELYKAVENAMGAHESPLSIVISTQAPTDGDLLSILIDDALAEGDPHTVLALYTVPLDDDKYPPFDEKTIRMANPAFGDFLNAKEIMLQADEARRMPSQEALYRNYTLNQRVETAAPYVTKAVWDKSAGEPEAWQRVYCGLDLSESADLTAFVMVSPVNGLLNVRPTFWLPEAELRERARLDRVPYDVWHKAGFLQTTPGHSIEYSWVAERIAEAFDTYDVRKVAFDRWGMKHLRPWLIHAGIPEGIIEDRFVDFGQGTQSMHPALRTLTGLLKNGKLRHGAHPVLQMCALNAVVKTDDAGWTKLSKKTSRGRIDGMVALAMASAIAEQDLNEGAVFSVPLDDIVEALPPAA